VLLALSDAGPSRLGASVPREREEERDRDDDAPKDEKNERGRPKWAGLVGVRDVVEEAREDKGDRGGARRASDADHHAEVGDDLPQATGR